MFWLATVLVRRLNYRIARSSLVKFILPTDGLPLENVVVRQVTKRGSWHEKESCEWRGQQWYTDGRGGDQDPPRGAREEPGTAPAAQGQ